MELQFSAFLVLFILLLSIFLGIRVLKILKKPSKTYLLPPGPPKLPLIGNLHQIAGSLLPYQRLRQLSREHGPVMHLQLGEVCMVIISSADAAKEVLKTHDIIFASRPDILGTSIITYGFIDIVETPYGKYWQRLRRLGLMELLSPKRIQSSRPIREQEVAALIQNITHEDGSVTNLSEKIFSLTKGIAARIMFGSKVEDEVAFTSFIEEAGPLLNDFPLDDMFPSNRLLHMISGRRRKTENHRHVCEKILDRIIADHVPRKADKSKGEGAQEDLVDVLLGVALQDANFDVPMITKAIKGVILETFIAASETSASVIDWAMSEMIKNPGIMQEAQAEVRHVYEEKGTLVDESCIHKLKFLKLIIKETLRLYPPGPLLLPRESIERCQINGYEIPAKSRTIINAWAIGRDPMYWRDADSFIPKRFHDCPIDYKGNDFEYIPFGSGRKMCPGILFAMANIELSLAMLLYHFDWSLPDGLKHQDLDMTETCSASLRRKKNLYVIPTPFRRDKMPLGL